MKHVLVLGSSGMLGSMVTNVLSKNQNLNIISASKTIDNSAQWKYFDIKDNQTPVIGYDIDWVINCIGIIKPRIDENDPKSIKQAIKINSLFPYELSNQSKLFGFKVIQIATDCVFSGNSTNPYSENSLHDALDIYGKTKSLGEIKDDKFYNLRCSIIGPEKNNKKSLVEWFLSQPSNAQINGFTNHLWNGITTYHFARICETIIEKNIDLPNVQHIVPEDFVTKLKLLKMFSYFFEREDIEIVAAEAEKNVNRTLSTVNPEVNKTIWKEMGYTHIPEISQLLEEMIQYIKY